MIPDLKSLLLKANVEEPSDELITMRGQAIEKFSKENASLAKFLNLIRFIFSLEGEIDFISNFRQTFREFDPDFPERGRIYELKILAYAVLLSLYQGETILTRLALQLAVNNCFGFGLRENPRESNIVKVSEDALRQSMIVLRAHTDISSLGDSIKSKLDEFQEVLKKTDFSGPVENTRDLFKRLGLNIKTVSNKTSSIFDEIKKNTSISEEEIRILWWVISNTSVELHESWNDLPWQDACMAAGKELADLITTEAGPTSYEDILKRTLKNCDEKKPESSNLPAFVLATAQILRETIVSNCASYISELTPIHYSILQSLEVQNKKKLQASLEKIKVNTSKQLTPLALAIQIYRERLYLRIVQLQEN